MHAEEDGIVIQHNYTGSIGTSNAYRSRTLTHEVGHWLNLRHPWGNSNNPGLAENCDEDDLVDDTPNTMGWTSCVLEGTTCGSLDNVQNYMDYSYCGRMFTLGQKDRMRAAALSRSPNEINSRQPQTSKRQAWQGRTFCAKRPLTSIARPFARRQRPIHRCQLSQPHVVVLGFWRRNFLLRSIRRWRR